MGNRDNTLLDEVLARLDREKGNLREIAKRAGVPYSTLAKLSARSVTDPRFSTVQALHHFFAAQPESVKNEVAQTH